MDFAAQLHSLLDEGEYSLVRWLLSSLDYNLPGMIDVQLRYLIDTGELDPGLRRTSAYLLEHLSPISRPCLDYINCLARMGEEDLASSYLDQLENKGWESEEDEFEYHRLQIYVLAVQGRFEQAMKVVDNLGTWVDRLNNPRYFSKFYMQKARVYDYRGSLLPAIENYQKAMDYATSSEVIMDYLDALHNLSNIYQYQGRYKLAVEGYREELEQLNRLGMNFFASITRGDLAWSYFLQGKDQQALELMLECYRFLQDYQLSENLIQRAEVLSRVIVVGAYSNANIELDAFSSELEEVASQTPSPLVDVYLKVSRATQLMMSSTFRNMGEAMTIFEEIIDVDNVVDIEFTLYAYLSLVNLHFQNYSFTNNPAILEDLELLVDRLSAFAEEQESPSIRFQADWIRGKLFLTRGRREQALELLTSVLKASNQLGFEHIANHVTSEIDHIDDDLGRTIEQTDFAYFRHDLTRQMLFSGQIQGVEEPQLFFIMGTSGMTLYTRYFEGELAVNVNLISSFVKAIETFGNEAMDHKETLNQIQYQENKILIEPKEVISLVFVIKGQTYPAQKKLLEFSKALDLPKYRKLINNISSGINRHDREELDELFDSIFVY